MSTPYEWRIDAIEQKAERACRELHRLSELENENRRLRNEIGEVRGSLVSALREFDQLRYDLDRLREYVDAGNLK